MNGPLLFLFLLCVHSLTIYIINVYKKESADKLRFPSKKIYRECHVYSHTLLFGGRACTLRPTGNVPTSIRKIYDTTQGSRLSSFHCLTSGIAECYRGANIIYVLDACVHILDPKEESLLTECV